MHNNGTTTLNDLLSAQLRHTQMLLNEYVPETRQHRLGLPDQMPHEWGSGDSLEALSGALHAAGSLLDDVGAADSPSVRCAASDAVEAANHAGVAELVMQCSDYND
jgi:hypothetical protein